MSELLNRMQGAIHSAVAREQAGFSGGIPWRVVQSWIVLVKALEEQLLGYELLKKHHKIHHLSPLSKEDHQPLPIDGQLAEYDDLRESP